MTCKKLAANEKSVSSEDGLVVSIFEQVADTVLGVAWGMQSLDLDVTNSEGLAMCGCLCDFAAVLSTDDGERVCFELVKSQCCSSSDEKRSHNSPSRHYRQHGRGGWFLLVTILSSS